MSENNSNVSTMIYKNLSRRIHHQQKILTAWVGMSCQQRQYFTCWERDSKIKFLTTWIFNYNLKEELENQPIFPLGINRNNTFKSQIIKLTTDCSCFQNS